MIRLAALGLLAANPATAHGTLSGAEGFPAGLAHPFLAGEQPLLLAGLGALIGRLGRRRPLAGLLVGLGAGWLAAWGRSCRSRARLRLPFWCLPC